MIVMHLSLSKSLCFGLLFSMALAAADLPKAPTDVLPGSITYDEIAYPYAVHYMPLTLYGQDVRMAYMDIAPAGQPNGKTVMLFHGMNFGGFYFDGPIKVLRDAGYRVIVPTTVVFFTPSRSRSFFEFNAMSWKL